MATLKLKGIDGDSHKRWTMWLNSTTNEEPYPGLDMLVKVHRNMGLPQDTSTGAAWLKICLDKAYGPFRRKAD